MQSRGGTFVYRAHDRFNPMGFSGGPVLTVDGAVIGTMLGASPNGDQCHGATVGNVRKRIEGR